MIKGILVTLLLLVLFVAGVFLEVALRSAKIESISVDSTLAPDVTISASRMPDFLWVGTSWWIEYESPVSFDLDLGSVSSSQLPAGKHRIYSNHDYSNLEEYGLRLSQEVPERIVVRQRKP